MNSDTRCHWQQHLALLVITLYQLSHGHQLVQNAIAQYLVDCWDALGGAGHISVDLDAVRHESCVCGAKKKKNLS